MSPTLTSYFNIRIENSVSIAPYQDSSVTCVFYNIFAYLVGIILVLAGAALAVVILVVLVAGICCGGFCAICKNENESDEEKNDVEETELNESTKMMG